MRPCMVAAEAGVQSVLTGSTKPHPRFRQRAKRRRRGPFSTSSPAQRKSAICTNYPWLSLAIFGAFVTPTQVGRQHFTASSPALIRPIPKWLQHKNPFLIVVATLLQHSAYVSKNGPFPALTKPVLKWLQSLSPSLFEKDSEPYLDQQSHTVCIACVPPCHRLPCSFHDANTSRLQMP